MNQRDLDNLEDVTPRIAEVNRRVDRVNTVIPINVGFSGALFHADDDGVFQCERTGEMWLVGRLNGSRVKRRM
jgi:hypothetical protein